MNILITGIHGFIGSNLAEALKKQHTIYGLDIVSPQKDGIKQTYSWDELKDIPPVDCIIHLAGKAHDTKNTSSEREYFDINVGLTQKIFHHFIKSSATKFVLFSSVKAVADSVSGDLHLPLNSERLRKLTESYVVSNAKIKQALSISQMPLSAQEGMKKTLDSNGGTLTKRQR